jgi:hypothetical protein
VGRFTASRNFSRSGLAIDRPENRRVGPRRSLPISTASDAEARSTTVGRHISSPMISVFLMTASYGETVPETLRQELNPRHRNDIGVRARREDEGGSAADEPGRANGSLIAPAARGQLARENTGIRGAKLSE